MEVINEAYRRVRTQPPLPSGRLFSSPAEYGGLEMICSQLAEK
jgi:hypothetical protein